MADQSSKINNISVFKFYEMTLDEFKAHYNELLPSAKKTLDECICFIHPKVEEGEVDQGNGYMYAHGKYYTMSLDANDLNKVIYTDSEAGDIETEVIRKSNLTPMDRIRLKNPMAVWVEIDNVEPQEQNTHNS